MAIEFRRDNGVLVRLSALKTRWEILSRPELGLSFRLLVPLDDEKRNNQINGEEQTLTRLEIGNDGRSALFGWDRLKSDYGGILNIHLTLRVTLDENAAIFAMSVENHSNFIIENVYCPYLGDIHHPSDEVWFKTFLNTYAAAAEWRLWPQYDNLRGYFGVDYPIQFHPSAPYTGAPMVPFFIMRGERQGMYAGVYSPSSELVAWHTELRPGYGSSIDWRVSGGVPAKDSALRFAAVHVPFVQPGETRELTPIALQPYQGGWQQGVDIYKRWRDTWFRPATPPEWARQPHAWQQIHINSPEDELRMRYTDLPQIGEECARHGVRAIQLVGWNYGGQDQGNPSHSPDPRLGTWGELKQAIAKIQEMGVKVILFSKFTWADRGTDWFRKKLEKMAIKDPYGDYYLHPGYQYQTATQLLDINTDVFS